MASEIRWTKNLLLNLTRLNALANKFDRIVSYKVKRFIAKLLSFQLLTSITVIKLRICIIGNYFNTIPGQAF